MNAAIGKNSVAGKELISVIEKIEALRAQKKQLSDDEKVVMAGAKAAGFIPQYVNLVIKARAEKPHDFQDYEQTRDLYLHAVGLAEPPPLFRQLEALAGDALAADAVIASLEAIVPRGGELTFQLDASAPPIRIWRDADGAHHGVVPATAKPRGGVAAPAPRSAAPVPDCNAAEAEAMGAKAFADNQPITTNPFPFGDKRRPRWDKGWRTAAGNDGMGPPEGDA